MNPARRRALALCRLFGMPYSTRHRGPLWDGTRAWLHDFTAETVLHELAHWLLASEERRRLVNYGLGVAAPGFPGELLAGLQQTISPRAAYREDVAAEGLALALCRLEGIDTASRLYFTEMDRATAQRGLRIALRRVEPWLAAQVRRVATSATEPLATPPFPLAVRS